MTTAGSMSEYMILLHHRVVILSDTFERIFHISNSLNYISAQSYCECILLFIIDQTSNFSPETALFMLKHKIYSAKFTIYRRISVDSLNEAVDTRLYGFSRNRNKKGGLKDRPDLLGKHRCLLHVQVPKRMCNSKNSVALYLSLPA